LPYGGNVVAFLEAQLAAMSEQQRIILLERHTKSRVSLEVLARRFGFSREKTRQIQLHAENKFRNWSKTPLIQEAEKRLSAFPDGYIPNSGGIPALDGELWKIHYYGGLVNWAGWKSETKRRLIFDEKCSCWKVVNTA
jgi:hypothetical protein